MDHRNEFLLDAVNDCKNRVITGEKNWSGEQINFLKCPPGSSKQRFHPYLNIIVCADALRHQTCVKEGAEDHSSWTILCNSACVGSCGSNLIFLANHVKGTIQNFVSNTSVPSRVIEMAFVNDYGVPFHHYSFDPRDSCLLSSRKRFKKSFLSFSFCIPLSFSSAVSTKSASGRRIRMGPFPRNMLLKSRTKYETRSSRISRTSTVERSDDLK